MLVTGPLLGKEGSSKLQIPRETKGQNQTRLDRIQLSTKIEHDQETNQRTSHLESVKHIQSATGY